LLKEKEDTNDRVDTNRGRGGSCGTKTNSFDPKTKKRRERVKGEGRALGCSTPLSGYLEVRTKRSGGGVRKGTK